MGRSRVGARLMACLLAAGMFAGCQPLYGGKPDKLSNPIKKKRPPAPPEEVVTIPYIDECEAKFREDPKFARQDTVRANALIADGEQALSQANKASDPQSQAELIKVAIGKLREALIKDPYNTEATLKLAVAYDSVWRKGCALALLKRIQTLQTNQRWNQAANRTADAVVDNKQWFKGYRKDAESAVGR